MVSFCCMLCIKDDTPKRGVYTSCREAIAVGLDLFYFPWYHLSMNADREYALRIATEAKRLEKSISGKKSELKTWLSRVDLAENSEKEELAEAAKKRVSELEAEIQKLEVEARLLSRDVEEAKTLWKNNAPERLLSTDAEALVRRLDALAGNIGSESEAFAELQRNADAEAALEELKRSMEENK